MLTDQQWLWVGVVHEIFVALGLAWLFWWYVRVPYPFERDARGFKRRFWSFVRWSMALVWGAFSLVHFFMAYWLLNYILTQPIPK